MRFTVADADDFDRTYLAFDGEPVVRDAVWGDLPRAAILYNMREPAWLLKEVLDDCLRDTRYEYHFARLMLRVANSQGAVLVLATPKNRVVGQTVFIRRDTFPQQHVATLSLRVAPAYMGHAGTLLRAAVDRAGEIGVSVLEFPVAASDTDLADIAIAAGFTEAARLPNRIRDGDAWVDLCLFELALGPPALAFHAAETFYANRHPWHVERLASGPSD
jgi:L-amino acid N-acyltransferase YncA